MRFFYADSQDVVDPKFDFEKERWNPDRVRHRDDVYAHELFESPPYDGLLVSKAIVDGVGNGSRYTLAQRHRFYRQGVREFFRIPDEWKDFQVIGDCGAFTYVKEKEPPYTIDEVLDFYENGQFDLGLSVDHAILEYEPKWDLIGAPKGVIERQEITLRLAKEFLDRHSARGLRFEPVGVAQGWSPESYAAAVKKLQTLGFNYIALGGMVPLKTTAILAVLDGVSGVLQKGVRLHLLGVTRTEKALEFEGYGVVSFDTTSPLRRAFKDDKDNYWTADRAYTALRVPQVEGNPSLMRQIRAGNIKQEAATKLERECLRAMAGFAKRKVKADSVLNSLCEYERLCDPGKDHEAAYRTTLQDRAWEACSCDVCGVVGYHVILFRGAERNRRRGFHNLWIFRRRLHSSLTETKPDGPQVKLFATGRR